MERLPEVVTSSGPVALPLAGASALGLAGALLADGNAGTLAHALARDPALALWTVIQAHHRSASQLHSVAALSGWLAPRLLDVWSPPGDAGPVPHAEPFAELAVRSFAVATLAAERARQQQLDDAPTYLLGLLHLAGTVWSEAGGQPAALAEVLPAWLRAELARVPDPPHSPNASPADCVCAAAETVAANLPASEGGNLSVELRSALAEVRAAWLNDAVPALLAHLVARLRRLRKLEADFQRTLEAEKLESLKEMAYGAGHEINNPLANISARAQSLLPGETDPQRRRMLASINAQAFRAHEMIADLMLFARPPAVRGESFDLAALLAQVHAELEPQALQQKTHLVLDVPAGPVEVVADRTQIAVALRSLCVNALEALVTGGRITVALAAGSPAGNVHVTVADNGPGIPPEMRPHIFDPYFSGREAGRGLGLGLSKCWRIVTTHRGRVDVDSPQGRGAVFTVTLPSGNAG